MTFTAMGSQMFGSFVPLRANAAGLVPLSVLGIQDTPVSVLLFKEAENPVPLPSWKEGLSIPPLFTDIFNRAAAIDYHSTTHYSDTISPFHHPWRTSGIVFKSPLSYVEGNDDLGEQAVADLIWGALSLIRQPSSDPDFESRMREATIARFLDIIRRQETLHFVFPGFPAKSPNHATKVLGPHPDLGEELALSRLDQLIRGINAYYSPGAEISVVSDGCIFAEAVGVPDESVEIYLSGLRRINPNPAINFVTINDFYPGRSHAEARADFLATFSPTPEEIRASIRENPERTRLYTGFAKFRMEDRPPTPGVSKTQLEKRSKEDAIAMMQCNDASARFIAKNFPDHIRLSIHPQSSSFAKIGINLLPSSHSYSGTPWHGVTVLKADGTTAVMKKREAEAAGYELVYRDGQPHHYKERREANYDLS